MEKTKKVAVIANTGLGDGLWMMVVANNFAREGNQVVLYSDFLVHLATLFPFVSIARYPKEEDLDACFEQYDLVVIQQHGPASHRAQLPPHVVVIEKEDLDQSKTLVRNLRDECEKRFGLEKAGTDVGLSIPRNWIYRAHPKRVVIHPSSANAWKNWPQKKYIALAKRLQEEGFIPQIVLPPVEAEEWNPLLQEAGLPKVLTLSWMDLTQFIYESGFLIGNDASAGHIASSLHVPTLTIFDRRSRAAFVRPGWGPGEVVLPPVLLFGRSTIKAFWKQCLSVGKVYRSFKRLAVR